MQTAHARWLIRCIVPLLLSLLPWIKDGNTWGFSSPSLAQDLPGKVKIVDRLQIERVGGLAGFGGPHLKSRGEMALTDLSSTDKQTIERLFKDPSQAKQKNPGQSDAFRYRITRQTSAGPQTIEVPEDVVPYALRNSVKDVIE